jgi:endonuclease YncB( thermonuclease family)
MKASKTFGLTALFLVCFSSSQGGPLVFKARVFNIVDGDTVHVLDGASKLYKIRYLGIDAPELHFLNQAQGKWGAKASNALHAMMHAKPAERDSKQRVVRPTEDLASGKPVEVEVRLESLDKYGRWLGYVTYANRVTNLEMVKSGWAVPYLYCSKEECGRDWPRTAEVDRYVSACRAAQAAKLGIFDPKDEMTETPDEFRRRLDGRAAYQYVGDYQSKKLYKPQDDGQVASCDRIRFEREDDAFAQGYRY